MADLISTAGRAPEGPAPKSPRREVVAAVRSVLRRLDASDDELDDALEALVELAKE